jgi:hypothetical protein
VAASFDLLSKPIQGTDLSVRPRVDACIVAGGAVGLMETLPSHRLRPELLWGFNMSRIARTVCVSPMFNREFWR